MARSGTSDTTSSKGRFPAGRVRRDGEELRFLSGTLVVLRTLSLAEVASRGAGARSPANVDLALAPSVHHYARRPGTGRRPNGGVTRRGAGHQGIEEPERARPRPGRGRD